MRLRLYVEDRYFQSYQVLAEKWHEAIQGQCNVDHVHAMHLCLDRMRDEMYRYVVRAHQDGINCVIFVADQESSTERSKFIRELRSTFEQVCRDLESDRNLQHMRVGLVTARSCLECWLLADVRAIVRFACRRGRHVNYAPHQSGRTESFSPKHAENEITHILRESARRAGKRRLKRIRYEKSAAPEMIRQMGELSQAACRNHSLGYFFRRITCEVSGCDDPQPGSGF